MRVAPLALLALAAMGANAIVAEPQGAITPQRVQQALGELEAITQNTLRDMGLPAIAVAVVHGDEVVYLKAFGVRDTTKPDRVDPDTVFQLASVSKPITSTVLAALVSDKVIGWDDRVIDHDPGFRLHDDYPTGELRLRDLLCHRSGLPDHCGDWLEDLGYDQAEILHRLRFQPPDSSFRAGYAYTNFGYTEAAVASARAAGMAWPDLAAKKLFQPLGMNATSMRFADYANAPNHAPLHVKVDGRWTPKHTRQPDAQAPAGGASASLRDLTRWMRLQVGNGQFEGRQLISAEALATTHQPQMLLSFQPDEGRQVSYGLGWNVVIERGGRAFWKHSGGFSLGMRTEVAFLPAEKLAIAVLSNAGPTGVPEGITESFFDLVLDGKLQRDWVAFANRMFDEETARELGAQHDYGHPPQDRTAALPTSAYAGRYANDFFGPIEVVAGDGSLALLLGPKPMRFDLRHWDRDVFIYQPTGESAGGPAGVRFSIGPDGKATQVLVENLDIHGQGTFRPVADERR